MATASAAVVKREQLVKHVLAMAENERVLNIRAQEEWAATEQLKKSAENLKREIITDEKLLSQATWNVHVNKYDNTYLEAKESSRDFELAALAELIESDHHCSFKFEEDISIHFSDYTVSIFFGKPSQIGPFIKKYNLKIDTSQLDNIIDQRQAIVDGLRRAKELLA